MALPPLQNLLDLLPDNTQGLIEPNDLRSITTDLYAGIVANGDTLLGYVRTDGAVTMDDGYVPSATLSVATKGYVDSVLFPKNFVQITGSQMSGDLFLPLYLPTEYTQAAHKGYVDSAVSAGVQGVVTTDTTNYKLITETPEGVKVRGLKASQNVTLTDDGTDITIKASVAGTGGDVRTDVSNVFDPNTTQTFDAIQANSAIIDGVDVAPAITDLTDDLANAVAVSQFNRSYAKYGDVTTTTGVAFTTAMANAQFILPASLAPYYCTLTFEGLVGHSGNNPDVDFELNYSSSTGTADTPLLVASGFVDFLSKSCADRATSAGIAPNPRTYPFDVIQNSGRPRVQTKNTDTDAVPAGEWRDWDPIVEGAVLLPDATTPEFYMYPCRIKITTNVPAGFDRVQLYFRKLAAQGFPIRSIGIVTCTLHNALP